MVVLTSVKFALVITSVSMAPKQSTMKKPAAIPSIEKKPAAIESEFQDDVEGAEPSDIMDRVKRRKLNEMWDEVPAELQTLVEKAKTQKDRAKMVNALVSRNHGQLSLNLESPYMMEMQIRRNERYNDQGARGVIYAEAVTKAGTEERLLSAIRRGEVKKATSEENITLYYFPVGKLGRIEVQCFFSQISLAIFI